MRRRVRAFAYRWLPAPAIEALHAWRRAWRRWRYRVAKASGAQVVTGDDVGNALAELGVGPGDVLMVHSALSRLGHVDGGAEAVLGALFEAVGPRGTIVMPAFPTVGSMSEFSALDLVFDVRTSPSRMGRLTECLRVHPEAHRSRHPTHSVVAVGPAASGLVAGHELCVSPFSEGSPFTKLIALGAKIVCIGVEIAYVSSLHVPEELMPDFPVRVYLEQPATLRVRTENGEEILVTTRVHDPAIAATRIEKNPPLLAELRREFAARGILRERSLGGGAVFVMPARQLEQGLEALALQGRTIYSVVSAP